ncbi:hypothetical protein [Echinicola sp. 20G]|uniref:hypothetical protein n=1 Tax=Echinicola sp. 20G TaxID=2781961 RepID=UPI001910ADC1|nr:hypothetical protein [Echinicola sp. 20G]
MAELFYNKWFELKLSHTYFKHGKAPVSIIPTRETKMNLDQNNVLIKQNDGSFTLYKAALDEAEQANFTELKKLGVLRFLLSSEDPYFYYYTDLPDQKPGEILTFSNDINSIGWGLSFSISEPPSDLNSFALLSIDTEEVDTDLLILTFNSRKVFIKYYIINSGNASEITAMNIYDDNGMNYNGPVEESLPNGQKAYVFTSSSLQSLQQMDNGPKLKIAYLNNQTQNMTTELPLPTPSSKEINIYNDGPNKGQFYCQVFVYI